MFFHLFVCVCLIFFIIIILALAFQALLFMLASASSFASIQEGYYYYGNIGCNSSYSIPVVSHQVKVSISIRKCFYLDDYKLHNLLRRTNHINMHSMHTYGTMNVYLFIQEVLYLRYFYITEEQRKH